MGERRSLNSGDVIAGRYELQDLVVERLGAVGWRAHDRVLSRNVGLELLPSDDPRAAQFLDAARRSTQVTDPRFLRVLDLVESDHDHHVVVREWARGFLLDAVLSQSPLPPARAAAVVAEVAEALTQAHALGQYHRRLSPRHVLLKQSGAVRIIGMGIASALAPIGTPDGLPDAATSERMDVESLGNLLYACLVSRWPGGHVDGLKAAPTEHGRLLRPRQVRAGVSREVDAVCDRILGDPPTHQRTPLTTAVAVSRSLRRVAEAPEVREGIPLGADESPDLMRHDPVVEPVGPPPGLEPPRRRPKAFEPPPPSRVEKARDRALALVRGDRGLIAVGIVGVLVLMSVLALAVGATQRSDPGVAPSASPSGRVGPLEITSIADFDPEGTDGAENADEVQLAVDGDPATGWTTSTYFSRPTLGGLKDGVGLMIDLGGPKEVSSVNVRLGGTPTSLSILTAPPTLDVLPTDIAVMKETGRLDDAGSDASIALPPRTVTRYVVVWLRSLPQVDAGSFRGDIREISIRGRS